MTIIASPRYVKRKNKPSERPLRGLDGCLVNLIAGSIMFVIMLVVFLVVYHTVCQVVPYNK
jgi:hypothetical protein